MRDLPRTHLAAAMAALTLALLPALQVITGRQLLPDMVLHLTLSGTLVGIAYLVLRVGLLHREAYVDRLTGSGSRRNLDRALRQLVARGRPFGLLFVDVDRLKQINDTNGHRAGDLHLRRVVRTLRDGLRGTDMLYRYGGDEFVLLLPGADRAATYQVLQLLATASGGNFTLGVATYPEDGAAPAALLKAADAAMYAAKQDRRDRRSPERALS